MSYDLTVYLRREDLPSTEALRAQCTDASSRVEIESVEQLMSSHGYLPVALDGSSTGFELFCGDITETDREMCRRILAHDGAESDETMDILLACDLEFRFSCKASDPREVHAMNIVAKALAAAGHGWFVDPQRGQTIRYPSS